MQATLKVLISLVLAAAVAGVVSGSGGAASAVAPINVTPPAISGTATVGQTLTASNGTWTGSPTGYAYQWLRCNSGGDNCNAISSATAKTYTLVGADAGHEMRVRVTASNADGSSTADSAATNPVVARAAPRNTSAPVVTGVAKVGNTLTADHGTWTGNPTSYGYQWQRCDVDVAICSNVDGATRSSYSVSDADLGFRLRVLVSARNAKGLGTAPSAPTDVVAPLHQPNGRPTLAIVSVRFLGSTVYARFRTCDDSGKNLSIIETDSRPGKLSYTRRFSTLVPPAPCGVYTRHWTPAARFRGPGRYTLTLRARDKSGATSLPSHRSYRHG